MICKAVLLFGANRKILLLFPLIVNLDLPNPTEFSFLPAYKLQLLLLSFLFYMTWNNNKVHKKKNAVKN